MSRRGPWLVLAGALCVLAAVMTGITVRVLSLEHERVAAEQREAHEGQVRLALWRIDTEVAGAGLHFQVLAEVGEGVGSELGAVGLEAVGDEAGGVRVRCLDGFAELAEQFGGVFEKGLNQLGEERGVAAA